MSQNVLVIGGTGAQGIPIVKELSKQPTYASIRVITRTPTHPNAVLLSVLPKVTLHPGSPDNDTDLRSALKDINLVFCNINSFALGIKNELYWGIRIYELAVQAGVQHFIWSSLDSIGAFTHFDDSLRAGHYYGKAHVAQWLAGLPTGEGLTKWSLLTTGPYAESLWEMLLRPVRDEVDGTYVFRAPINDGAIPFVHLDDLGPYVHWLFSHPEESAGMDLKVAIEHVPYEYLAKVFTKVTGNAARFENVTVEEWVANGPLTAVKDGKLGVETAGEGDNTLLTYGENFGNWFRLYQRSGGNRGLIRRDYELLDRVLPGRVKSMEEWMRKVGYNGSPKPVLKGSHAK